jgi:hypothetical protein
VTVFVHTTTQQAIAMLSTLGAGWMMTRVGVSKRMLKQKISYCAACGRRRGPGRCPCTGDGRR